MVGPRNIYVQTTILQARSRSDEEGKCLKVRVVARTRTHTVVAIRTSSRSHGLVRIDVVDGLEVEFALEFALQAVELRDEQLTCGPESLRWSYGAVCLDLEQEVWFQRVRDLVPGEEDVLV